MSKGKDLYKMAGVDIDGGEDLVKWLKSDACGNDHVVSNRFGHVVEGIGGFAGLFRPKFSAFKDPILVASTDGVGTKLLLALEHSKLDGIGIDLVAMCVNDLYCCGGYPLFFIDYYATGKIDPTQFKSVLSGIKEGLSICKTALLGGETAELPGLYGDRHFDLAGFVVGVVDGDVKLGPARVREGDLLYALESSGFHSNGYSLIRSWLIQKTPDQALVNHLLSPTQIYTEIPDLIAATGNLIHGVANITGGGISGNLSRILNEESDCEIDEARLPMPKWMRTFIDQHTNYFLDVETIFNLGAGMILAVDSSGHKNFEGACVDCGLKPIEIGRVTRRRSSDDERRVHYVGKKDGK